MRRAPPARFERAAPWVVARCSDPLSYGGSARRALRVALSFQRLSPSCPRSPAIGATKQRMRGSGSRVPPARASCLAGRRRATRSFCTACSRTITCQIAVDARGAGSCLRAVACRTAERPTWRSAQVGRCPTAPETGGDDRTLPSTSSPAGTCTDLDLRLTPIIPAPEPDGARCEAPLAQASVPFGDESGN